MCGICGIACSDPRRIPLDAGRLRAMTDSLTHRGPDDRGELLEEGIALGMRRLSIIDLEHGQQPSTNEAGTLSAIQNGEIYNFRTLLEQLAPRHRFSSRSDTEVIVHLYEEHGPGFARALAGMYAIAVWDRPNRRLTLARDRMGIKPLYLCELAEGLAFASEVRALIAAELIVPRLDPVGAELFLTYGYVPGPYTLFAGVRKLLPGTVLTYEDGAITRRESYWNPWEEVPERRSRASWSEDCEELLAILRRSVREHMVSDVPLGLMLSGGVDSSLIGALMAQESREPIKTFSVGFANRPESNELDAARHVARRIGSDHHELVVDIRDDPATVADTLWHLEEPITDLSALGFGLISAVARREVTVALSGQGADELFGGYRKHQIAYGAGVVGRVPGAARLAAELAARAAPGSTQARGYAALAASDRASRLLAMSRIMQAGDRPRLLGPELLAGGADGAITDVVQQHFVPSSLTILGQTLAVDRAMALVDLLFLYFDKMSMAHSLEVRVPFVDHRLVEFSLAVPDTRLVWMMRRKEVLRRAARGLVDEQILRKRKMGFLVAALAPWLQAHSTYVRDVLLEERTRDRGVFSAEGLRWLSDGVLGASRKRSQMIFAALALELWQRVWIDGGAAARLAGGSGAPG